MGLRGQVLLRAGVGTVCFALIAALYVWSQSINPLLYVVLLTLFSGFGFVLVQAALFVPAQEALQGLSRVPKIEELINEAQEKSGKVETLNEELTNLQEIVEVSARQRYLQTRLEGLQGEIKDKVAEIDQVEREMSTLGVPEPSSLTQKEIRKVEEILELRKDGYTFIGFGKHRIPVHPAMLSVGGALPAVSLAELVWGYWSRWRRRKKRQG